MENEEDNNTDKIAIIDVFINKQNLSNEDYFLNEQASEPVSIADIYFDDKLLSSAFPEKSKSNEKDEKVAPHQDSPAQQPEFIIIDNVNLNSRILIDSSSLFNSPAVDKTMINLNRLNGNNRSVLKKLLPKPNTIHENARIINNGIITAIITYKCVICSVLFINFKDFQAHLKEHYYCCEECPEKFLNQFDLLNHLQVTHSYNIIKRPDINVEKIEVLKVFPSFPMIENIELGNADEDVENFYIVEDESEVNYSSVCDDSYITLEEAKELQMKMEEEALGKKNVKRLRNI